jgi:predicted ATPase
VTFIKSAEILEREIMPRRDIEPFVRYVELKRDFVPSFDEYPFNIPAVKSLERLQFHPQVTYFIGENGSGKSTVLEAIAILEGFNPEGGSRNFHFSTADTHSDLANYLRCAAGARRVRTSDSYFLRAESFYNVASEVDRLEVEAGYGGKSLHARSHGESFFTLITERFRGNGLYLLDEPESALSPKRQLSFLTRMHDLLATGSQFIIATHSPIILAYPESTIYQFSERGIETIRYEETDHFQITQMFLTRREAMLRELLREPESE